MSHNHDHGNVENIKIAFFLNLGFTILELVGGFLTNSVAITADAIHDLGDSCSLGLSWYLEKYSEKTPTTKFSYGYRRFSLLGSLINAIVLIVGSIFVLREAIPRLLTPEQTNASGMIFLAIIGVIVNGLGFFRLSKGGTENVKVMSWHLLEDVLGWAVVLIGAIVISFTDFFIIDPILSIVITIYILWNVVVRLNTTISLFLQSTPSDLDTKKIETDILNIPEVAEIHHLHSWSLDGERHVLTLHVKVDENITIDAIVMLKEQMRKITKEYDFEHITIEIEIGDKNCSHVL